MDYIIIGLLILLVIIGVISLFKNINESNITERLGKLEVNVTKEIGDFKSDLSRTMNEDFNSLTERMDVRLNRINDKVNDRIDENFEKTNKTFNSVLERLSKIDEAQKKIDTLSNDIVSLQGILTDKKSRGIFGEVNLKHIMSNVFGEKNDSIYQMQFTLPNSTIVDCILFAPQPLGMIGIDSKFPLEHYQMMVDKTLSLAERQNAEKLFKADVKKHIDAISNKYIINGVTSDQAIMFLPAEAIFAEINAYHPDLVEYSYKKRVWITSPTTLISTLTVIQVIMKNMERDKYTSIIHEELNKLGIEFGRYKERWDKLSRSIQTVNNDVENIHKTTEKITKRFDAISGVDVENMKKEIEY
ncbi:MAG: DNA recombination protein RmuC [Firmicutes bacterium]|nr:DNA recombination protein RmuC [Bacillota bacterium]